MGIKNLPHSHEVGIKNWWTISDLFYIHQRKHLHHVLLVHNCLCYQCTKWNSFAIRGNHVKTCLALRLGVTLLLLCPIHMRTKWYHQMHLWMRSLVSPSEFFATSVLDFLQVCPLLRLQIACCISLSILRMCALGEVLFNCTNKKSPFEGICNKLKQFRVTL